MAFLVLVENYDGGNLRNRVVVDPNTGEIITEIGEKDRIVRGKSLEAYKNIKNKDIQYREWKIEHFYMGNVEELRKMMKKLDIYEKAFLFSIAPYIGYEDCCLKHPNNGVIIKFESLLKITGISRSKLSGIINSLIDKDILFKGKNSNEIQYFVNPWLFCKGNRINKVLKTMFQNYQIQVFDGTKWKDLKE